MSAPRLAPWRAEKSPSAVGRSTHLGAGAQSPAEKPLDPLDRPIPRVVVHVPHAHEWIPRDLRNRLELSDLDLKRELLAMTDRYADHLFSLPPALARMVVYRASRLVVDPERFVDDALEPMARKGMGVIYTRTSDGRLLRGAPTAAERQELLARFYKPHHERLTAAVEAARSTHGDCLLIDGHSFPSRALPYEDSSATPRPEICIGTDPDHTPDWLRDAALATFATEGFHVAADTPFAGALVPSKFFRKDFDVFSVMVEVNRGLYMDETTGDWLPDAQRVRGRLRHALERLIDDYAAALLTKASPRPRTRELGRNPRAQ